MSICLIGTCSIVWIVSAIKERPYATTSSLHSSAPLVKPEELKKLLLWFPYLSAQCFSICSIQVVTCVLFVNSEWVNEENISTSGKECFLKIKIESTFYWFTQKDMQSKDPIQWNCETFIWVGASTLLLCVVSSSRYHRSKSSRSFYSLPSHRPLFVCVCVCFLTSFTLLLHHAIPGGAHLKSFFFFRANRLAIAHACMHRRTLQ